MTCPFTNRLCPHAALCRAFLDLDSNKDKMEWKHDKRDWDDERNRIHLIHYMT